MDSNTPQVGVKKFSQIVFRIHIFQYATSNCAKRRSKFTCLSLSLILSSLHSLPNFSLSFITVQEFCITPWSYAVNVDATNHKFITCWFLIDSQQWLTFFVDVFRVKLNNFLSEADSLWRDTCALRCLPHMRCAVKLLHSNNLNYSCALLTHQCL